jgi:hypothetical protein
MATVVSERPHRLPAIRTALEQQGFAAYRASPALASLAIAFFAAFLITACLGLVDGRTLYGVSVWWKPAKFFLSIAIHSATLAWGISLLREGDRRSRGIRLAAGTFVVCSVLEMTYVTLQAARAEPSHFNQTTALYLALYALMGAGALAMLMATGYVGRRLLKRSAVASRPALVHAVGLGMLATAILGTLTGAYMAAGRGHWVGSVASDTAGLPFAGWSTIQGDLRVAHFFGMHSMQVLALAGLLASRLPPLRANRIVTVTLLIWGALTAAILLEAVLGRPFLPV